MVKGGVIEEDRRLSEWGKGWNG